MSPTVALPGSMTWMGIRLSSGSRCPQSPKGLPLHLLNRKLSRYGSVGSNLALTSPIPQTFADAVFPHPSRHRAGLRCPARAGVPRLSVLAEQPTAGSVALGGTRPAHPDTDRHHHE